MLHRGFIPVACLFALGACATTEATSRRMLDLNRQALVAFEGGELKRARELLLQAVQLGKKDGLSKHNTMARTYLDLGAVYLALQEREKGLRHLGLALRIEPDIQPSEQIATAPVKKALAGARAELKRRRNQAAAKERRQDDKEEPPPPPSPKREEPVAAPRAIVKAAPPAAKAPTPAAAKSSPPPAPPAPPPAKAERPETPPVIAKAPPPPPEPEDTEPDLPATVPKPLYCPTPDAAPPSAEINLRCVLRPGLTIARMSLFYRSAGSETFTQVPMVRSAKGWYQGLVPASAVVGNSLQYYVEAQGSGKKPATTTNGQSDSPNLMSIRAGAAPVGQGTLAAARFARPKTAGEVKDDDPLLAAERERSRVEDEAANHHRRPGAVMLGVGIGSGWGWHPTRVLEFRSEKQVGAGFSSGGLVQLTPEVGYQLNPVYAFSLQLRYQYIPESGSGDTRAGHPRHSAWAVLARGNRFYGEGNGQFFLSATLGGGQGFRLVVPPRGDLVRNDTVRGGPIVLGPGAGFVYHFTPHFAWVAEGRLLAGVPDLAAVVELSTGGQVAF